MSEKLRRCLSIPIRRYFVLRKLDIGLLSAFIEVPLTRCVKCKAAVASTDAVLDALRVGQEALQKATRLQFSGNDRPLAIISYPVSSLFDFFAQTCRKRNN